MKKAFVFLLAVSIAQRVLAQCPTAGFSLPTQACLGENIYVSGTATVGVSYEWDFCSGDLQNNLDLIGSPTLTQANPFHADLVKDGTIYRAFISNPGAQNLFRLDYFKGLNNTPVLSTVSLNASLSNPRTVRVIQDGQSWYGLIADLAQSKVYRLKFGTDLTSSPIVEDLNVTGLSTPQDLDIVKEGNNFICVVANFGNSSITRLIFSGSMDSAPSVLNDNTSGPNPLSISLSKVCNQWYGFMALAGADDVTRINFGSDLSGSITSGTLSVSAPGFSNLRGVTTAYETGNFWAFVSTQSGDLFRLDFGSSPALTPTNTLVQTLAQTVTTTAWGIEIYKDQSDWFMYLLNYGTSEMDFFRFHSACASSPTISQSSNPSFAYSTSGAQTVSVMATDAYGNNSSFASSINVQNLQAPDIDFSSQNYCAGQDVNFTSVNVSGDVTNYAWDFGDGMGSSGAAPGVAHAYSGASEYNVTLNVTGTNLCHNFIEKAIQIFNPPLANFDLPVVSPFCTNQNYSFTNTSTYDVGSSPTWQWSLNGTDITTAQDLNYVFTTNSAQSITLTAAIPGCSTQSTQTINSLANGPLVTFNSPPANEGCVGSPISFTNTTGGNVDSQSWDFGDGNNSTLASAAHSFSTNQLFPVTLTVTSGQCQNSATKNVTIYSVPQPDFKIEAPPWSCERSPAQFDNLTQPQSDSNITSWVWGFGDSANGSLQQKNPSYTYASAGDYAVTLTATSDHNCSNLIQKTISIYSSPTASLTASPACLNQNTVFTNTSTGDIVGYRWDIDNQVLTDPNTSHTFNSTGSYPITLTAFGKNGCINQLSTNVIVPVRPVVNFIMTDTCTRYSTTFQELNPNGADPAKAWNWNFGVASATGAQPSYLFPTPGFYTVTMNTTRESGCVYSVSRNVLISPGPTASFSPSVFAGGAPLSVSFNNTSTADSYFWNFGDAAQTTSTDVSPTFSYTALGHYKPLLTAKNKLGCIDTLSAPIDVVIPNVDIVMKGFSLAINQNSNASMPVVTIENAGNIPLVDPEISIDLGGTSSIKEKISGLVIRPGKTTVQTLDLQIAPGSLQYVCAEIDVSDDVDTPNNKQCIALSVDDIIMSPYPNPSTSGQITMEWISTNEENVNVTIYKSTGEVAFEQTLDAAQAGLGQLIIDTSSFENGLYLIQFAGDRQTRSFRVIIAH